MEPKKQREKRQFEEGRRDGFHNVTNHERQYSEPLYAAGWRQGVLERLAGEVA